MNVKFGKWVQQLVWRTVPISSAFGPDQIKIATELRRWRHSGNSVYCAKVCVFGNGLDDRAEMSEPLRLIFRPVLQNSWPLRH